MIMRDSKGDVIFLACRQLFNCADAVEAELAALEEGLNLALHWTPLPIVVETDCAEACLLIEEKTPNTSMYSTRVRGIRELMRERVTSIARISRDANIVSHELAKYGRGEPRMAVWLSNFPQEVCRYITADCNPIIF
uniref:Uncharacterized protein n=1 Tax=Avena sativa TaxID=4498 RepID=A0ACD5U5F7_AVESA